jgi:tetratricopeptide (TPR) repeat protein
MKTTTCSKQRRAAAWLAAALAGGALSASAAYVIQQDGTRKDGIDIRLTPDGNVLLTTAPGQQATYAPGQYQLAVADKPAEYDKAVLLYNARKYDEVIALLTPVASKLRGLFWDAYAGALIIQAQIARGDALGAVGTADRLLIANPKLSENAVAQDAQRQALIAAKQFDRLEGMLTTVLNGASRPDAARAQVGRGDLRVAQNRLEEAVMDFLRAALLYPDVKDEGEVQAEALAKAASTLQQMKDARGSQHCLRQLLERYPASRAAARLAKR